MTNEEKKAILLKAIEIVKGYPDNRYDRGICHAIDLATGGRYYFLNSFIKGLGIVLPEYKYYGAFMIVEEFMYSFPLTKEGDAQRIALLEEAIKKLELWNPQN